jgi:hypothetical protein
LEKEEHSSIVGGTESPTTTLEFQSGKLDLVLPEEPAIQLLGIYPEDVPPCNMGTCSTMLIEAIFIIVRSWKQPRCPSTEE